MSEISIKAVCCTCLSTDRNLHKISRLLDGISILFMLLTHDTEANKEGLYKDTASLRICWECTATMHRIKRFRIQACVARRRLSSIADGRSHVKLRTLSRLTITYNTEPEYEFQSADITAENFIDCGPVKEIKSESDSDDLPLSVFYYGNNSDDGYDPTNDTDEPLKDANEASNDANAPSKDANELSKAANEPSKAANEPRKDANKATKNACEPSKISNKSSNFINEFNSDSVKPANCNNESTNEKKEETINFKTASKRKQFKQGNIIKKIVHKTKCNVENDAVIQTSNLSIEAKVPLKLEKTSKKKTKMKYEQFFCVQTMNEEDMKKCVEVRRNNVKDAEFKCDKCIIEFENEKGLNDHNTRLHENKIDNRSQCDICYAHTEELPTHRQQHYVCYKCVLCAHTAYTHMGIIKHLKGNHKDVIVRSKEKKRSKKKRDVLKLNEIMYPCPECDSCFQNKDLRWKHIQRAHREGFKCNTCDKKFAFKNNLERHVRIHAGPLPREECQTCRKMVRVDLIKAHARIHADRQPHTCVECDKRFVSRATYESHLKYARAHATVDVCRHKCPSCHKRYRTRAELQDHVNYLHKGKADHICPVCGKGLATKRCIRRHVRRAHEGIKESAKNKICQQCGKAFRDKKGLIEHERVHTGARPLSCATCGRAFRQRAALYVHTRRLHRNNTDHA